MLFRSTRVRVSRILCVIVMLIAKSTKQLSESIFKIRRAVSLPDNRNRKRPIQVKFFVDEKELSLIKARMAQLGIENMSAYLRKMAIDGYAAKPDLPERREPKNP